MASAMDMIRSIDRANVLRNRERGPRWQEKAVELAPRPMPDLPRMYGGKRKQKHSPPLRMDQALPLRDLQTLDRWRKV